jgi:hypothetical protein
MRKTLIRSLTFIFGLYFVLEFLLPKEIGGNFDKTALSEPAVLHDAELGEYRMYYVGVYNRRSKAIGLATSKDGVSWEKYEGNPVIRPSLFNSADRLGFSSLCPIKIDGGYELYYLGHDMDTPPRKTICWATSSDGLAWKKHGRLEFEGETPWRQHDELDESAVRRDPRYTSLQALAATVSDGRRVLFIAQTNTEGLTELLQAERAGTNGAWVVGPEPLPLTGLSEVQKITSLTYLERDGVGEFWMYLSDNKLCRATLGEAMPVELVLGTPDEEEEEEGEEAAEELEEPEPEPWRGLLGRLWTVAQPPWEYEPPEVPEPWSGLIGGLWETTQPPWDYEGPDPLESIDEMTVFLAADGYRLVHAREKGGKRPEDEMAPMALYTLGSANGAAWELPREWAYMGESPVEPVLVRGPRPQPTYLSRGFEFMGTFLSIIAAFAIGLGGVNMVIMQGRRIGKGGKGIHNSVVFLVCLVFMFVATIWGKPIIDKQRAIEAKAATQAEVREGIEEIKEENSAFEFQLAQVYDFVFYGVQFHLGATLFALVSFYMVGAAFRSFRVKSAESGFLILSATIVLLGQIPLGAQLGPWLPKASEMLLNLFNAAAYRGVLMGMAVAAISVSVRLWLGLEKGMFHGT